LISQSIIFSILNGKERKIAVAIYKAE